FLSLYDVAALSLQESDESLTEEIIEKAARLFGACRLAVALKGRENPRYLVFWGFREGEEPPDALEGGKTSFAYRFTRGLDGSLYMETGGEIAERQRKLLTIFAKRLEEIILKKEMEQRIRESEREKSLILNSILELLMFQDTSHRILWVNRAAAELAGKEPGELRGRFCYEAFHGRISPCEGCPAERALKTGWPEEERISSGGRELFVKAYPVKGKDGLIERFVVVGADVTESARAGEAFRTIFNSAHDAIFIHDRDGKIVDVNQTMLRMYGLETKEEALSLSLISDYSAKDAPASELPELWARALAGEELTFEWKARRPKDGSVFDAEVTLKRITLGDSDLILATVHDITQHKRETELLKSLFTHSPIGMYIAAEGRFQMVNPQFARLTGYSEEELIGRATLDLVVPEDRDGVRESAIKMLKGEKTRPYTFRIHTKTGGLRWIEETVVSIWHEGKRVTLGNIIDVTQKKRFEERLKYLSIHDGLTGLYNRAFFEEELRRLNTSREYPVTFILGDVNGLKLINDTLGHDKGDRLLIACAQALKRALRNSDIIARVGGDEFVVLLPRTDERNGRKILERIQESVERYNREQPSLPLSISFGMATADSPEQPLKEAYKRADDLMYEAKHELGREFQSKLIDTWLSELLEQLQVTEDQLRLKEELCRRLGERAGLSPKQLANLSLLLRAQDLGMVGMPEKVLRRGKRLTKREQKLLRQHPERGYRLALFSNELSGIAELILKHHENWDGSGYPLGLKGEEIPIECRILSIVEAFTKAADERRGGSPESALEVIRGNAGSRFDPKLAEIFIKMVSGEGGIA
ncbi:MAG: PAS domain S-box protein, partial [Thermacetogeniaceae bacterium]